MKKLFFPIILIIFVVIGGISADFLRHNKTASGAGHETKSSHDKSSKKADSGHGSDKKKHKDDGHSKDKGKKDKAKKDKKDSHGKSKGHDEGGAVDSNTYLKFKRQFVVPVMKNGAIEALVIMNINLVLGENAPANAYNYEPKLRDAIVRDLLMLSNKGAFGADLTSAETYQMIRNDLLQATRAVLNDGVEDVLILDIARQEQ